MDVLKEFRNWALENRLRTGVVGALVFVVGSAIASLIFVMFTGVLGNSADRAWQEITKEPWSADWWVWVLIYVGAIGPLVLVAAFFARDLIKRNRTLSTEKDDLTKKKDKAEAELTRIEEELATLKAAKELAEQTALELRNANSKLNTALEGSNQLVKLTTELLREVASQMRIQTQQIEQANKERKAIPVHIDFMNGAKPILKRFLRQANKVFGDDVFKAFVVRHNEETGYFELWENDEVEPAEIKPTRHSTNGEAILNLGVVGYAYIQPGVQTCKIYKEDALWKGAHPYYLPSETLGNTGEPEYKSFIAAPLIGREGVKYGVLCFNSKIETTFSRERPEIVVMVASLASCAADALGLVDAIIKERAGLIQPTSSTTGVDGNVTETHKGT